MLETVVLGALNQLLGILALFQGSSMYGGFNREFKEKIDKLEQAIMDVKAHF